MTVFVADEQRSVPVDLECLRRLAQHVLAAQGVPETMEVNVLCVDRDAMAGLHERHLGEQGPTDVLAFPLDLPGEALADETAILGDVVLCPEVASRQAAEHATSPEAEIAMLLVHGVLHLLGYDHAEPAEQAEMTALTERLLASFAEAS